MRRALVNLGLALASLAVTFLLAELAVRVFVGPVPPRNLTRVPAEIRAPAPFPGVPFLMRPNAQTTQDFGSNPRGYFDGDGTLTYRTNSLGWRSPEFRVEKEPGTFRILGLGDSFTFGTGVRSEDLFLSVLREALAAELPGRTEVINLGVMGYDTSHEIALLRNVGLTLDPDLVVICYVLNDAEVIRLPDRGPGRHEARVGAFARAAAPEPSWQRYSQLLAHLRERIHNREAREHAVQRIRGDYRDGAPGWIASQRALLEGAELARAHGFELVLMIFPILWQLDDGYPFAGVHAAIAAAAQRAGIPVLDLIDAFRGEDGPSLWVHPGNQHPNERAHAIAASALHRFLRERGLLPSG